MVSDDVHLHVYELNQDEINLWGSIDSLGTCFGFEPAHQSDPAPDRYFCRGSIPAYKFNETMDVSSPSQHVDVNVDPLLEEFPERLHAVAVPARDVFLPQVHDLVFDLPLQSLARVNDELFRSGVVQQRFRLQT